MTFYIQRTLVTILSLSLVVSTVNGQTDSGESCNVDSLCTNAQLGAFVADPYDCYWYYVCIGDPISASDPLECRDGMYFDESFGDCVTESSSNKCLAKCGPPKGYCETVCNNGGDLSRIPDPNSCSQYFICGISGHVSQTCPTESPYFDGSTCTNNPNLCCSVCMVFCTEEDINHEIRNPNTCNSYYYCDARGYPTRGGTCNEPGSIFDPVSGACAPGTCGSAYCSGGTTVAHSNPPSTTNEIHTTTVKVSASAVTTPSTTTKPLTTSRPLSSTATTIPTTPSLTPTPTVIPTTPKPTTPTVTPTVTPTTPKPTTPRVTPTTPTVTPTVTPTIPQTSTATPLTTQGSTTIDPCIPYCNEDDVFKNVPDPEDCTQFYFCLEVGVPSNKSQCEDGWIFDDTTRACVEGDSCESICPP